jgi:biotin transporter BioY
VAAAFVTGILAEKGLARHWLGALAALVAGDIALYVPGVIWLGSFIGIGTAIGSGFLVFVVGDALKIAAGWGVLSAAALALAGHATPKAS